MSFSLIYGLEVAITIELRVPTAQLALTSNLTDVHDRNNVGGPLGEKRRLKKTYACLIGNVSTELKTEK